VNKLPRIIEAILFAADGPLTVDQISLGVPRVSEEEIGAAIRRLQTAYDQDQRGYQLNEVAGGWQIVSHPDLYDYVKRFLEGKRRARLSRAALEALAVIAYRQPITRGEIEEMRGVDCGGVLHTLLERDLITVRGRSRAVGRPLIYGTTETFLTHFGLTDLGALPKLEEIEELLTSEMVREQLESEADRRMGRLGQLPVGRDNGGSGEEGAPEATDSEASDDAHGSKTDKEADPVGDTLPEG
jgi:segregation and condensation protein B